MRLISSVERLEERVREYDEHAPKLTQSMPYNRAWYAVQVGNKWIFGPSKFVGYEISVKDYLNRPHGLLDGRVTEGVLQRWSDSIEKGHPKYDELYKSLNEFCAGFAKKPNSLARISIVKTAEQASTPTFQDDLVSFMIAVYRNLTPAQQLLFRKQLV